MEFVRLSRVNEDDLIEQCRELLTSGSVVAFPTETFYGLGARYDNNAALKRLYELKKRPFEKAIPLIIGSLAQLDLVARDIPPEAVVLMEKYWPGPLTVVLPANAGVGNLLTGGTAKIAIRMPGESFALRMVRKSAFPVTATSANPSGAPPAESDQDVLQYFGENVDLIVDGGQTYGSDPSTIVEIVEGDVRVLREGRVKRVVLD